MKPLPPHLREAGATPRSVVDTGQFLARHETPLEVLAISVDGVDVGVGARENKPRATGQAPMQILRRLTSVVGL